MESSSETPTVRPATSEQDDDACQGVDWTQLPGPCRQLIALHMDTITRAVWRAVSRVPCHDVYAATSALSWRGHDPKHLRHAPLPRETSPEPTSSRFAHALTRAQPTTLPLALMAKLPGLHHLQCAQLRQLSSLQGIPHTLRSLDLGEGPLEDLSPLQHCTALQQLLIHCSAEHMEGIVQSLPPVMQALGPSLRWLLIDLYGLGSHQVTDKPLLLSLAPLTRLQQLSISLRRWGPQAEAWRAFAPILAQMTDLQLLSLACNDIGPLLPVLVTAVGQLRGLRGLQLAHNHMGAEEAQAVARALSSLPGQLTQLDLGDTGIGAAGAAALAPVVRSQAPALVALRLTRNRMAADGIAALSPCLRACSALRELDLAVNDMCAAGAVALAGALPALAGSLAWLNLATNDLGYSGAAALAPALGALTALTHLDYSRNELGEAGAQLLAPSLQALTRLQHLELAGNQLKATGVQELAPALGAPRMPRLQYLNLYDNHLREGGAEALAAALGSLARGCRVRLDLADFWLGGRGLLEAASSESQGAKIEWQEY